jgi:hypothetical protein
MNQDFPERLADDEWQEWYLLTPQERWRETQKLWAYYLLVGGSLDPEPDSQSPFDSFLPRSPAPMLKYHQAVFDRLGLVPRLSESSIVKLAKRERKCKVAFPPSMREWYSIEGAVALLDQSSNGDSGAHALPLARLGESMNDHLDQPNQAAKDYLLVFTAGEAGLPLYVHVDGSDDPPVYVDNSKYTNGDTLKIEWLPWKPTFSKFVFDWMAQADG